MFFKKVLKGFLSSRWWWFRSLHKHMSMSSLEFKLTWDWVPFSPLSQIFLPRGWKSIAVGLWTNISEPGCTAYRPFFWSGDKTRPKKWKKKLGSSRTDCCFTATVTQLRGGRQLRQGQQSGSTGLPAKNSSSTQQRRRDASSYPTRPSTS